MIKGLYLHFIHNADRCADADGNDPDEQVGELMKADRPDDWHDGGKDQQEKNERDHTGDEEKMLPGGGVFISVFQTLI